MRGTVQGQRTVADTESEKYLGLNGRSSRTRPVFAVCPVDLQRRVPHPTPTPIDFSRVGKDYPSKPSLFDPGLTLYRYGPSGLRESY